MTRTILGGSWFGKKSRSWVFSALCLVMGVSAFAGQSPVMAARVPFVLERQGERPAPPLETIEITSLFGSRVHPVTGIHTKHEGVDYDAELGDEVFTILPGKVKFAGWKRGYGKTVEVQHPRHNVSTLYAHLSKISVRKGQKIAKAQKVGEAGSTGLSTGVHLHFGVRNRFGRFIEPLAFLAKVRDGRPSYVARVKDRLVGGMAKRPADKNLQTAVNKGALRKRPRPATPLMASAGQRKTGRTLAAKSRTIAKAKPAAVAARNRKSLPSTKIASSKMRNGRLAIAKTNLKLRSKLAVAKINKRPARIALSGGKSTRLAKRNRASSPRIAARQPARKVAVARAPKRTSLSLARTVRQKPAMKTTVAKVAPVQVERPLVPDVSRLERQLKNAEKVAGDFTMLYSEGVVSRNARD